MKDEPLSGAPSGGEFFGREAQLKYVCGRAAEKDIFRGIYLLGRRWVGKTEFLRRVREELFFSQEVVVPVYYQFKGYSDAGDFAEDYLREVIRQYIAFFEKDPHLAKQELSLKGLRRLLENGNMEDLAGIVARHAECKENSDHIAVFRNAISIPAIIKGRAKTPLFLILDDFDTAGRISLYKDGPSVLKEYMDSLASQNIPFLASLTSSWILSGGFFPASKTEVIPLEGLKEDESLPMMIKMCGQYNIEFDTEILALTAKALEGSPMYIRNIIWAARKAGSGLSDLREFVELYVEEITEGDIAFSIRSALSLKGLDELAVLYACANSKKGVSKEELKERFSLAEADIRSAADNLKYTGLLTGSLGFVRWAGDRVVRDYINYMYETEVKGRDAEEVKTDLRLKGLREGFSMQSAKVAGALKDDVAELLKMFNGQKAPKALFRNLLPPKGVGPEDEITLPYIAGCFDAGKKDRPGEISVLISQGFHSTRYDETHGVTWIVGIKEGMIPVSVSAVEDFTRQSNLLMEKFKITTVARWLVSREGFTREAALRMDTEGVWATDYEKIRVLKDIISEGKPETVSIGASLKEFEMTLPTRSRAELVAANTAGEIASEMGFDEDSAAEIKTAVIEACINAFEHSKLKSANVHLRFVVGSGGLALYVQNAGRVFDSLYLPQKQVLEGGAEKRGWGIEMMRGLMDVVRFEKVKGGTRVVMVKYLKKNGEGRDEEKK